MYMFMYVYMHMYMHIVICICICWYEQSAGRPSTVDNRVDRSGGNALFEFRC